MDQQPIARTDKIFVGGITATTTEEDLKKYFEQFGEIKSVIVMRDPNTGGSRGFGFCIFAESQSAAKAIDNTPHTINGKVCEVKAAIPKESDSYPCAPIFTGPLRTTKIFVGGLHYDSNDQSLYDYFSKFGKLSSYQIMVNKDTNKSRGFGFVIFEDKKVAEKVLKTRLHFIDNKEVEVKEAIPKKETKHYKELHSKLSEPNTPPPVSIIDETAFRRSYPYIQLSSQMQQHLAQIQPNQQQHQHQQQQYLHNPNVSVIMDPIDMINYQMNNLNISPASATSPTTVAFPIQHPPPPPPPSLPQTQPNIVYSQQQQQQQQMVDIMPRSYSSGYSNDYYYKRPSQSPHDGYDENNTQMMNVMRMQHYPRQQQPMFTEGFYRPCEIGESMIYQQQPTAISPPRYLNDQYMVY